MAVERVRFGGWENNLRLSNAQAELIVTLDVGPRVISYRSASGKNIFKTFEDQLGGVGETQWLPRGGHRFWLAPEDPVLSYLPDNSPVAYRVLSDFEIQLENAPNEQLPIRKVLRLVLDPGSARVTLTHRAENCGCKPWVCATWGLTMMRPGGIEIIPLPPLGSWPRDLLPNRRMVLWPYTDTADPRWRWGRRFITLRQANAGPTKLGLVHCEGWVAYHNDRSLFLKTIACDRDARYPDDGCNFETFTNAEMLETEALGPLIELAPGESTGHTENWELRDGIPVPPEDEENLANWVTSLHPVFAYAPAVHAAE